MGDNRKSVSTSCCAPKSLSYYQAAMELVLQLVEAAKTRLNVKDVTIKCISVSASQFVQQVRPAFERSGNTKRSGSTRRLPVAALQQQKIKPPSVMDAWLSKNDNADATKNTFVGVKRSLEGREGIGTPAMKRQAIDPVHENEATRSR